MPTRSQTGRKVFITNLGYHDFSPAKRFGDLVPCTKGNIDIKQTDRIEAQIQNTLDASEAEDFLLISGHPVVVCLATGYWFRLHRSVNLLYWDPLLQDYRVRSTDFSSREAQIEALLLAEED